MLHKCLLAELPGCCIRLQSCCRYVQKTGSRLASWGQAGESRSVPQSSVSQLLPPKTVLTTLWLQVQLPQFRKADLEVTAIFSRGKQRARQVAEQASLTHTLSPVCANTTYRTCFALKKELCSCHGTPVNRMLMHHALHLTS